MKTLFLTLTLLISVLAFAQDGYKLPPEAYQEINATVSKLDTISARALADRLARSNDGTFAYMQTKTTDKAVKYYYTRTNLGKQEQKDQDEMGCSNCLVVFFKNQPTGLDFWQVSGNFEELLPMWQTTFLPDANAENAKDNFRYREVKDKTTGTDIRFSKASGSWSIKNYSH